MAVAIEAVLALLTLSGLAYMVLALWGARGVFAVAASAGGFGGGSLRQG